MHNDGDVVNPMDCKVEPSLTTAYYKHPVMVESASFVASKRSSRSLDIF